MPSDNSKTTILFIDDDEDFASALSIMLEREGYSVRQASDGEIGVRMAGEQRPDLIILDFMMPVMNGFDALVEIRKIDGMADVPVIALTSLGQDIGEIHGLRAGDGRLLVQETMDKPVEPNMFLDRVASTLVAGTA